MLLPLTCRAARWLSAVDYVQLHLAAAHQGNVAFLQPTAERVVLGLSRCGRLLTGREGKILLLLPVLGEAASIFLRQRTKCSAGECALCVLLISCAQRNTQ